MSLSRLHIARIIAFVAALQILNLSIFTQDFQPLSVKHHHTIGEFNQINSVTEYIAEILLNYENAFPEFHKEGHKDLQSVKHIVIKLITADFLSIVKHSIAQVISYAVPTNEEYHFLFCKEINPPPPKA